MTVSVTGQLIGLAELGYLPDKVCRAAIRRLCRQRLQDIRPESPQHREQVLRAWIAEMDASPLALAPVVSNEQHYEVPPEFFAEVLGPHRKYSSAYWGDGVTNLEEAEEDALRQTCERAELQDGQRILELGCGWGSLTLFMAARFPHATITAVSHSHSQRSTILALAAERGLRNVEVITCDMNTFEPPEPGSYDRVVSVEMFEHMRNYRLLMRQIAGWMRPGGKLFVHVFSHRETPYPYVDTGSSSDWMTRHFFAGGMMPSDDLLPQFQDHLQLEDQWVWSGQHYAKTLNAWLERMDGNRDVCWPILQNTYGDQVAVWWGRWRLFFMACAEFFGLDEGRQWRVCHYRFVRPVS